MPFLLLLYASISCSDKRQAYFSLEWTVMTFEVSGVLASESASMHVEPDKSALSG